MVGVIRTLIILFVIYYLFKFLGRYVFPFILRSYIHKVEKEMRQHQGSARQERRPEGEVTIDYTPPRKSTTIKSPGDRDYVDFEEIK
jgi:hypothetical protein